MPTPVPFGDRSGPAQVLNAGCLTGHHRSPRGVLIGVSAPAYWTVAALAGVGALSAAGFEHPDGWTAADRGLVSGLIYGTGLLLGHALAGTHAKVCLGSFPPLQGAIIGMLLSAAGGRIAQLRQSASPTSADAAARR